MPASKIKPEDTFAMFHSNETFTSVARKLGVVRLTLQRWWIAEFGEEAFAKRLRTALTPEQRLEKRHVRQKVYREVHAGRIKEVKQTWAQTNADRINAARKAYRETHREECSLYNQTYYAAHAEEMRERSRKYGATHRETLRVREKTYYTQHPATLMLKNARKRAKERDLPFDITAEDIRALFPADNLCPITRQPLERGEGKVGPRSMSLDRIVPDLGYVRGNVAVISHLANTIKQNCNDPEVFRRLANYVDRTRMKECA